MKKTDGHKQKQEKQAEQEQEQEQEQGGDVIGHHGLLAGLLSSLCVS